MQTGLEGSSCTWEVIRDPGVQQSFKGICVKKIWGPDVCLTRPGILGCDLLSFAEVGRIEMWSLLIAKTEASVAPRK